MTVTPIAELEELLAKATPGPWAIWRERVFDRSAAIAELIEQVDATDPFVGELFMLDAGGKCPALTGCGPTSEANAELIVAAVNALPELLSTLSTLSARVEWQPIETAPKDGTLIDIWRGGEFPARVPNVSWREPTDSEWWAHGGDTIETPAATWHDMFGPLGKDDLPTHWMPLPTPPSSEQLS